MQCKLQHPALHCYLFIMSCIMLPGLCRQSRGSSRACQARQSLNELIPHPVLLLTSCAAVQAVRGGPPGPARRGRGRAQGLAERLQRQFKRGRGRARGLGRGRSASSSAAAPSGWVCGTVRAWPAGSGGRGLGCRGASTCVQRHGLLWVGSTVGVWRLGPASQSCNGGLLLPAGPSLRCARHLWPQAILVPRKLVQEACARGKAVLWHAVGQVMEPPNLLSSQGRPELSWFVTLKSKP